MMTYAGHEVTREQVRGTIRLLDYLRRFLKSDCYRCINPEDRLDTLTKEQARRRLAFLINTAINRKAGIPDHPRGVDIEIWRDCQLVQHLMHGNNPSGLQWRVNRTRLFRTNYIRKRYGHLEREWADNNDV